jgi:hypothetical protein
MDVKERPDKPRRKQGVSQETAAAAAAAVATGTARNLQFQTCTGIVTLTPGAA